MEYPTLSELLGGAIILGGLGLSLWGLIDDLWDLVNVRRFGEIGGPRWISAEEHLFSDLSFLGAWTCILGVLGIAIYLPARTDPVGGVLALTAGWLRFGATVLFLLAQVNRRVGRQKLRNLPLEAWEQMLASMMDGMSPVDRDAMTTRLLAATAAGREMGHRVANDLTQPVAALDAIATDERVPASLRSDAALAIANLDAMLTRVKGLHAEIKAQEGAA